ncbi:MAG: pyridoxal phosphate-dependent aminotransferase [Acidobacteria bacterium]|nr:pyridoxal phosphate-dependent aminotransferase [Acidobacteriota bacterium]
MVKSSLYMTWAKHHASARFNLANSGMIGCDFSDLPVSLDDVSLNGFNHEGYLPLKQAIVEKYGVTPDQVVTAQGTSMANFLAMATAIDRGDEVLIEQPAYDPLLGALNYLGAEIRRFHRKMENEYQIDIDEIERLITSKTRLIVITSPHNPSGFPVERSTIEAYRELAATVGAKVLVDEVYRDILFETAEACCFHLGPQFLTTSSLTKSYGLSGLRCGWILCDPDFAERARRLNDLFGAVGSVPSDTLSVAAFRNLHLLESRTRSIIDPNIALVREFLNNHRNYLDCIMAPRTMIAFPRLKNMAGSDILHDLLRKDDTSIVPGRFFESPQHFRLGFAVRTEDVLKGLNHLSTVLHQLG